MFERLPSRLSSALFVNGCRQNSACQPATVVCFGHCLRSLILCVLLLPVALVLCTTSCRDPDARCASYNLYLPYESPLTCFYFSFNLFRIIVITLFINILCPLFFVLPAFFVFCFAIAYPRFVDPTCQHSFRRHGEGM